MSCDPFRIDVLFFDGVEELDAVGPWEVLRFWQDLGDHEVDVRSVSLDGEAITCMKGLRVSVDGILGDRTADLILYPGGHGTRALLEDVEHLDLIRRLGGDGAIFASVCTGSLVLGAAGLLDGKKATTHWMARGTLSDVAPQAEVIAGQGWVDAGQIITGAGISAGIDMALHLVDRFDSRAVAHRISSAMEYRWYPEGS